MRSVQLMCSDTGTWELVFFCFGEVVFVCDAVSWGYATVKKFLANRQ